MEIIPKQHSQNGGEIMRGDVWVKKNSRGEVVVCIDNGKFVSEKVIKPAVKDKKRSMK